MTAGRGPRSVRSRQAAAAAHFDERQLSAIIMEIALTNFFNRINHTIREQAGKTG